MITGRVFKTSLQFFQVKIGSVRCASYNSIDYCMNVVRTLDNENYLCTLLLPSYLRSTAFAIRAFNVEIASVQDQVSKSQLGAMRLKFWEESIDKIFNGKVPNNPVAVELAKAVKRHKLSGSLLKQLIAIRNSHLNQPSFNTLQEMEKYAQASCTTVYLLLLQASGIESAITKQTASYIGTAQGLTNLIRGIPHCIKNRELALPSDLLAHYDISEESIFRGNKLIELQNVVKDVVDSIHFNLNAARHDQNQLPGVARKIFLPATAIARYKIRLENSNYDLFDPNTQRKSILLPFQLYFNSFFNRF